MIPELLWLDMCRYRSNARRSWLTFLSMAASNPGLIACGFLRLQGGVRSRRLKELIRTLCLVVTGADFAPGCRVDGGLLIQHPSGIVLGAGVRVGPGCTILQGVTCGVSDVRDGKDCLYPAIGASVVLGAGCALLGPVKIGNSATIGANAVVLQDIPAGAIAVGAPARVVRRD
jgi:serine O-acetyltransferase